MTNKAITGCTMGTLQAFLALLWLSSLGVLGVCIWLFADELVYTGMRTEFGLGWFYTPVQLLISSSVFGVIAGIIGLIGAVRGNKMLIIIFTSVLFVVTVLSFVGGGLSWHYRDEVRRNDFSDYVEDSLVGALAGDKLDNRPVELQAAVRRLQERFLCCGLTFSDNWVDACADETCRNIDSDICNPYLPCRSKLDEIVVRYLLYVAAVGFAHGSLQCLGLLFMLYLLRNLGRGKKKEQEAEMEKMQAQ